MKVLVNGSERELGGSVSVADLVRENGLTPERVAVEVNRDLVRRADYAQTPLRDGDRVEIVTFVGGG